MLQLSSSGRRKLVVGTCCAGSAAFASPLRRGMAVFWQILLLKSGENGGCIAGEWQCGRCLPFARLELRLDAFLLTLVTRLERYARLTQRTLQPCRRSRHQSCRAAQVLGDGCECEFAALVRSLGVKRKLERFLGSVVFRRSRTRPGQLDPQIACAGPMADLITYVKRLQAANVRTVSSHGNARSRNVAREKTTDIPPRGSWCSHACRE